MDAVLVPFSVTGLTSNPSPKRRHKSKVIQKRAQVKLSLKIHNIFVMKGKFNILSSSGEKSESQIKSFTLYMSPAGSFYSSMHIPLPWPSNRTKQGLQACRNTHTIIYSNVDNMLQNKFDV